MKLNLNQRRVLKIVNDSVADWTQTNDISSPSHFTLIEENIYSEDLDEDLKGTLMNAIDELYRIIKDTK